VLGILPIPFANLPDVGKVRGHSDLERIIPNLKMYNDILNQWSTQLTKFKPKLVQSTKDVGSWLENNGATLSDFNPQQADFIVNKTDDEKSEYIFLQGMSGEYQKALETHYWLAIQGSSIPEMVWGLVSTGNHASSEEQMGSLMQYVYRKQTQATKPFEKLFQASLDLMAIAGMFAPGQVSIDWNDLEVLSPTAKAAVVKQFSEAMEKLVVAGAPLETIHKMYLEFYPNHTEEEFKAFRDQMSRAATMRAFMQTSYDEQLASAGTDSLDELLRLRGGE